MKETPEGALALNRGENKDWVLYYACGRLTDPSIPPHHFHPLHSPLSRFLAMLDGFLCIGPRSYSYAPETGKHCPGQLVIICTWLGASRKHISKYTTLYKRIAPDARILLIESNVPILVSSYAHQRRQIQCAVSAVLDTLSECGYLHHSVTTTTAATRGEKSRQIAPNEQRSTSIRFNTPKIALHAFSNGGVNTATQLLIELRKRLYGPLPLVGVVLDSCPAKGTYWRSYNAMVLSLPPGVASRLLGVLAVHFLLILLYTWIACGNENPASLMRRTLLDDETLCYAPRSSESGAKNKDSDGGVSHLELLERPKFESDTATASVLPAVHLCYLYSKADQLVEWTDIQDHAKKARRRGWRVTEVLFEDSAHCAHMSRFEEQYTSVIEAMWQGSSKSRIIDAMHNEKVKARL